MYSFFIPCQHKPKPTFTFIYYVAIVIHTDCLLFYGEVNIRINSLIGSSLVKMLIYCPYVPCNSLCVLFVIFVISLYFVSYYISEDFYTENIETTKEGTIQRLISKDKLNGVVANKHYLEDIIETKNSSIKIKNLNEFNSHRDPEQLCTYSLIAMSICMFFICNTVPEHFFRRRFKLEKCLHIVVEKECGCTVVYDTIKDLQTYNIVIFLYTFIYLNNYNKCLF